MEEENLIGRIAGCLIFEHTPRELYAIFWS